MKVLAAGVSLPDVLAREGVHPETPRVPYTPGWDLVGTIDQLGEGVTGLDRARPSPPCLYMGATHGTSVSPRKLIRVPADWTRRRRSRWC